MHPSTPVPWREAVAATLLLLVVLTVIESWNLDRAIAFRWAFDALHARFRAREAFWANELLHAGGRNFVLSLGAAALWGAVLGLSAPERFPLLRREARRLIAGLLGMGLTVLLVGTIKHYSNVDCPWDLIGFGGANPYVDLFAARPSGLPPAGCFPAAHAASGYALFAFYFAFRGSRPRLGRYALVLALVAGAVFGTAQQARGAHFVSHDVWSAYIAWMTGLLSQGWLGRFAAVDVLPVLLTQRETRSSSFR